MLTQRGVGNMSELSGKFKEFLEKQKKAGNVTTVKYDCELCQDTGKVHSHFALTGGNWTTGFSRNESIKMACPNCITLEKI